MDFESKTKEMETLITRGEDQASTAAERWVPALTLLAHPDVSRVGERIVLPVLAVGQEVRLSRLEPVFTAPEGGASRPLRVPHLSRQSIHLSTGESIGSVRLDLRSTRTTVEADGRPVEDQIEWSDSALERGVVLTLGHRVALLLHILPLRLESSAEDLGLIGASPSLERLRRQIRNIASLDMPVLLRGETGTGKELAARALHQASARSAGPFVAVNMAALPPALAASELFGAAKGAFTGAAQKRNGFFQAARSGTLFLDEIGETSLEVQVLLLRALETGKISPVGSVEDLEVNVRVVAATDADLESDIAAGRFRAPLYHRLAGYSLRLPALRERRDDIGRLFFHFLNQEVANLGVIAAETTASSRRLAGITARLAREDWPGNVRQLRNIARRVAISMAEPEDLNLTELLLEGGQMVSTAPAETLDQFSPPSTTPTSATMGTSDSLNRRQANTLYRSPKDVSDDELLAALRTNGWRLKPTAAHLRVSRTSLYALIDRCPQIRRATDLLPQDLEPSFERHAGNLQAMADELEVSPQGLRHRLQELGIASD